MLLRIKVATHENARVRFRVEQALHEEPCFKRLAFSFLSGQELPLDESSAGIAAGSTIVLLKRNCTRRTKMQVD